MTHYSKGNGLSLAFRSDVLDGCSAEPGAAHETLPFFLSVQQSMGSDIEVRIA